MFSQNSLDNQRNKLNMKKDSVYIERFQSIKAREDTWYKVLKFLGKGGNGTAYLVLCTGGLYQGAVFTLKIFHKISSEARRERFLREIVYMKGNHHPNILQQYDEGEWNGYPYVVMEYMPLSLYDALDRKSVSFEQAMLYSLQLLSALKTLHSLGFVHRDIKPGNIYIKSSNAILGDFGLIKKLDEVVDEEDVEGYIAMPRFYRSPELVEFAKNGAKVGFESDVFQLGLVFAEMFTGSNPESPSDDLTSEVVIRSIPIPKGKYGRKIWYLIQMMLKKSNEERICVDKALQRLNLIYEEYKKDKVKLTGDI